MDLLNNPITSQVISIIVAAVCGWLGASVSRLKKRDAALYEGMRAVLRRELVDDYERYVQHEDPLTIERMQEIHDCYAAYAALGGNGTAKTLYDELAKLKPAASMKKEK